MIAVLMSALLTSAAPKGDTLSTRNLATKARMFQNPPAVFLDGGSNVISQDFMIPVFPLSPYTSSEIPGKGGKPDVSGPQTVSGGIKRVGESQRQKK